MAFVVSIVTYNMLTIKQGSFLPSEGNYESMDGGTDSLLKQTWFGCIYEISLSEHINQISGNYTRI